MGSLINVGVGVSIVMVCLLFGLVAEAYYLLRWKKRVVHREESEQGESVTSSKELLNLFFCWKSPTTMSSEALNPNEIISISTKTSEENSDALKQLGGGGGEEGIEAELMRLHNLAGPPRFLFTILEETREDLESEDGKSRGKLSDLFLAAQTPILTPLSSPPTFTPPRSPLDSYSKQGFNPLFEPKKGESESWVLASPPPKFKFLRDAEEKLYRKTLEDEAVKVQKSDGLAKSPSSHVPSVHVTVSRSPSTGPEHDDDDGSFITIRTERRQEKHNSGSTSPNIGQASA